MKTLKQFLWILAASTLAFSCTKEEAQEPNSGDNHPESVNIKVVTDAFTSSKSIRLIEDLNGKVNVAESDNCTIAEDGSKATFDVTMPWREGDKYTYWGVISPTNVIDANSDLSALNFTVPAQQKLFGETFDSDADILLSSKVEIQQKQPSDLNLTLTRPSAIVEMTLEGIGEGELISEVRFTTTSASIAGKFSYNLVKGEAINYGSDNIKEIVLSNDVKLSASALGTKVSFLALPCEINDFTVSVITDKSNYMKTVDRNKDGLEPLAFVQNSKTSFVVKNLFRGGAPKLSVTWDENNIMPLEGGVVEIPYTLENPLDGALIEVSSDNTEFVSNLKAEDGKITCTLARNAGLEIREFTITVGYTKDGEELVSKQQIKVRQAPTVPDPVMNITWAKDTVLPGEGGTFTMPYTLDYPVDGAVITLTSMYGYLSELKAENGTISFTIAENPESQERSDYLIWSYDKDGNTLISGNIKIKQDVVALPELSFTLETVTIKQTSVFVNCTPSDPNATYIIDAVEKSVLDATNDQQYMKDKLAEWKGNYIYIPDLLKKGDLEYHKIELKKPNTDYYLIAYGMNEDNTFTTSKIEKLAFRSAGDPPQIQIDGNTWDNTITHPNVNAHHDVTVNILNPEPNTDLKAESQTSWITNVTVTKESDTKYIVGFDIIDYDYTTRSGKIKLTYGSAYSKRIEYQRGY